MHKFGFIGRCGVWWVAFLTLCCGACHREAASPLRIGLNPWPSCAYVYLAQELGYMREEGCNVRLLSFSSLEDVQRAYARNQLHGMYGTTIEFLQIRDTTSHRPQIVQIADISLGGDVLLGKSWLRSVADLRGGRIGCETGSVSLYLLARALQQVGLTLDDVELVTCDQYQIEQLFLADDVDAVVTYPPVSSNLIRTSAGRELFSSRELPDEILDALFIDEEVVRERADEIAALMRAVERAIIYAERHPVEAHQKMARYLLVSPEELKTALKHDVRITRLAEQDELLQGTWLTAVMQKTADVMLEGGQLLAPADLQDCISTEPARGAMGGWKEPPQSKDGVQP